MHTEHRPASQSMQPTARLQHAARHARSGPSPAAPHSSQGRGHVCDSDIPSGPSSPSPGPHTCLYPTPRRTHAERTCGADQTAGPTPALALAAPLLACGPEKCAPARGRSLHAGRSQVTPRPRCDLATVCEPAPGSRAVCGGCSDQAGPPPVGPGEQLRPRTGRLAGWAVADSQRLCGWYHVASEAPVPAPHGLSVSLSHCHAARPTGDRAGLSRFGPCQDRGWSHGHSEASEHSDLQQTLRHPVPRARQLPSEQP